MTGSGSSSQLSGAPRYSDDVDDERAAVRVRQRYGFATDDVVFTSVGAPSLRNRVPQILSAFAQLDDPEQKARLLLLGNDPGAIGAAERVTLTGPLDDQDVADHLAASDVWLSLQWPDRSDGVRSWLTSHGGEQTHGRCRPRSPGGRPVARPPRLATSTGCLAGRGVDRFRAGPCLCDH